MKLELHDGLICGYLCDSCNSYNDILTVHCWNCKAYRDGKQSYIQLEIACAIRRGILNAYDVDGGGESHYMNNDERSKLYSSFYNPAKDKALNVGAAGIEDIVKWEVELELIILQAKAEQRGYSDARREIEAGLSKEQRDRLITRPHMPITEGINAPKVRKDRMSAKDKLIAEYDGYVAAGLFSQEDADRITGTVRVDGKPKTVAQQTVKTGVDEKPKVVDTSFTFNKKAEDDEEKPKPFNPARNTQESLLADLLEGVNLESTDLKRLEASYSTAAILVGKTANKLQPDRMILLGSRIAELQAQVEEKKKLEKKDEPIVKQPEPSTTSTLKLGKLFG